MSDPLPEILVEQPGPAIRSITLRNPKTGEAVAIPEWALCRGAEAKALHGEFARVTLTFWARLKVVDPRGEEGPA